MRTLWIGFAQPLLVALILSVQLYSVWGGDLALMFCYYHKTGTKMASNLVKILQSTSCKMGSPFFPPMGPKLEGALDTVKTDVVNMLRSPDAVFDWSKFGPNARIIHLVRDPVDLIISGYLYHAQNPPPEKWLIEERHNLCKSAPALSPFVRTLETLPVARNLSVLLNHAHVLCKELEHKHQAFSMHGLLKNADRNYTNILEGLRVEAMRSIFQPGRSEQLRMAANSVAEYFSAPAGTTHRVYLTDLPAGDLALFNRTMSGMLDFLNDAHNHPQGSGAACIDKQATMDRCVKEVFVPDTSKIAEKAATKAVHVTSGFLSAETKDYYRHKLLVDPVLGPVLRVLQYAILDTTRG